MVVDAPPIPSALRSQSSRESIGDGHRVRFRTDNDVFSSDGGPASSPISPREPAIFQLQELRHGVAVDKGGRSKMEDVIFAVPDLEDYCARPLGGPSIKAFFAVFDGHGGVHAAEFCRDTLLRCITQHEAFPTNIERCMREGFLRTEGLFYDAWASKGVPDAGSTALAVLVWGETLYVANLGDSRAVMCRAGKTVPLTRDHKPTCVRESKRIQSAGGFISADNRVNDCLSVSRAIGNFSLSGLKCPAPDGGAGMAGPLIAEPEMHVYNLTSTDEFLILACDGLWDQFSNERVIELARDSLKELNDPQACVTELVREAKRQNAVDNLSVLTLCFSSEAPPKRRFPFNRSLSVDALAKLQGALCLNSD